MTAPSGLARDTSVAAMDLVVERWRQMSPKEKLDLVDAANRSCDQLAAAGIRMRHPDASDLDVRMRLAALRLGRDLVVAVYGWDPVVEGW